MGRCVMTRARAAPTLRRSNAFPIQDTRFAIRFFSRRCTPIDGRRISPQRQPDHRDTNPFRPGTIPSSLRPLCLGGAPPHPDRQPSSVFCPLTSVSSCLSLVTCHLSLYVRPLSSVFRPRAAASGRLGRTLWLESRAGPENLLPGRKCLKPLIRLTPLVRSIVRPLTSHYQSQTRQALAQIGLGGHPVIPPAWSPCESRGLPLQVARLSRLVCVRPILLLRRRKLSQGSTCRSCRERGRSVPSYVTTPPSDCTAGTSTSGGRDDPSRTWLCYWGRLGFAPTLRIRLGGAWRHPQDHRPGEGERTILPD